MTEISFASDFSGPNVAALLAERFLHHRAHDDWHAVASMVADDLAVHDMRGETASPVRDGDALTAILDTFGEDGGDLLTIRIVAERGHRHALVHITLTYPPLGEEDLLLALECSEAGQVAKLELFDGGSLADAGHTLAELHISSLPDDHARIVEVGAQLMDAIWTRDIVSVRALLTEDMHHVDHRQKPPLTLDRTAVVDLIDSVLSADPDVVDLITEFHRISHRGIVASRAQTPARPLTDLHPEVVLVGIRDGLIDLVEFYDEGDRATALAHLQMLETA